MSLTPIVYKSTDPGAPALTGQAGSLRDLLRAVLVTGYGSAPNVKAAAGWTEPFTGTNKAVFRNQPVAGTGGYLRIDDSSTVGGSNARYALWRMYATMSDVDTGTGVTPTSAQKTDGGLLLKSGTLDSTARAWVIIATQRFFYLFVDLGNTASAWTGVASFPAFFGDLISRKPGDSYHFAGITPDVSAYTGSASNLAGMFFGNLYSSTPGTTGFLLRDYAQATAAKAFGLSALSDGYTTGFIGSAGTYPDAISGGIMVEKIMVAEGVRQIRGFLPNVYGSPNGVAFTDLQAITDFEGVPVGTTILAKRVSQGARTANTASNYHGMLLFDISNNWAG